eukprot:XP_001704157.1 Hypothetical protein GL50803_3603 [Giardia lamblia ATCC 50803]
MKGDFLYNQTRASRFQFCLKDKVSVREISPAVDSKKYASQHFST